MSKTEKYLNLYCMFLALTLGTFMINQYLFIRNMQEEIKECFNDMDMQMNRKFKAMDKVNTERFTQLVDYNSELCHVLITGIYDKHPENE